MKLAVFMDELSSIKPKKDSTIAMLESAQKLGWQCSFFTQNELYCRDGEAFAQLTELTIGDVTAAQWVKTKALGEQSLHDLDIILIRKDPPFTMEYIYALYALELAEKKGVLVANSPQGLRDTNEKMMISHFPQCCAPTLVTSNIAYLKAFWKTYNQVIFKPLDAMGGKNVFRVTEDGNNISVILELLTQNETVTIMAQQYIPAILKQGDKRILLIDGYPAPYGLARMPAMGEIRGNLAAGGSGKVVPLTTRDRWICEQIGPTLREKNLSFVGIDVIGDFLTEINVTSPTCIREITAGTGLPIADDYMQLLKSFRA